MNNEIPMFSSYNRYKEKCLVVLNESLEWNIKRLPNNTLNLQLKKVDEEIDEVVNAKNYQETIKELADVLIAIGGVARFNEEKAVNMFNNFINFLDKFIFMDMIDYAEQKIKILYERSYSDGYKHDSCLLN